jgi:hypothetical protein
MLRVGNKNMIPIAKLFLINELVPMWPRMSVGNTAGPAIQTGRVVPTATEKIEKTRAAQRNVVPIKPVDLGMKPFKPRYSGNLP